ncbi:MAG: calcium-binding protein, partial [Bacteroidetes bacterium]|nr:calcium-binding protein [Bacteroidota bacterium]
MKLESRIVLDGAAVAGALDHATDHDDAQGFDNDPGEMNVQDHQEYNTEGDVEYTTAIADAAALIADNDSEFDRRADAPVVTVTPSVSGDEDTTIPLTINIELTNGSDTLKDITISGVPAGAELSAGVNNNDGSWTLTQNQLAGLTLTPPEHSGGDFTLTVSATTEDSNGDTATDTGTINVTLNAVADKPILNITNIKGLEKDAIPLNIIAPSLADKDGSETLGDIIISGVPDGVTLSAGTYDENTGTWSVSSDQLGNLTLTSQVENSFTLTVSVTATESENGDSVATAKDMQVTVDPKADAPIINVVSNTSGNEDTAIPLTIQPPEKTDMDETLSDITISGVPADATLSAGTYSEENNTWTLTAAQLDGLTITPAPNSDADFTLTVSVTSTEPVGGDSATAQETIRVTVNAVADRPDLAVSDTVSGNEGEAIPLGINSPSLKDTDGSESIQGNSVTISGVPDGAVLSAGVDNGDETWTVSISQLQGLTITPADKNDFTLTVSATSVEESNQDTATATATIDVVVDPGVHPPELSLNDTSGNEDEAIGLDIDVKLYDQDGTEELSEITISGVPAEASLSAGTYDENEGVWKLDSAAELVGLSIDPPENFSGEISLTVSATSTDGENTATATGSLEVTVIAVADKPELNVVSNVSGNKGEPISLSINSPLLTDTDGSESIKGNSVIISGVPETAVLSDGVNNGDETWTVHVDNLSGLTVTSSEKGTLNLTVSATSVEESNQDEATETSIIRVNVNPTANPPVITLDDTVTGNEDESIPLDISIDVSDSSSEIISDITISGVPAGAELSAGINNEDGSWTLTKDQLSGLTITPALHSARDFSLTVSAISRETGTGNEATASENIDVTVIAVADDPILNVVNNVTGYQNEPIGLKINPPSLVDTDGSEKIFGDSVVISGVPSDAVLSAGTDNGNGSWTVNVDALSDITITTTDDSDFALTVRATSVEDENGDTASVEEVISVTVDPKAGTPIPGGEDATGYEDKEISLTINPQAANPDSETLGDITIYDVPAGATLSAGTYNEEDGTWTLTASELQGLTITPPLNSDEDFNLRISVTATNTQTGEKATATEVLEVTVFPDTDGPNLSVANSTGLENTDIKLNINSPTLIDTDGSEVMVGDYVTITGVPDNATLSAGENMGDGTWQVSIDQLSDLTIRPGDDNEIQLVVSATAKEKEGEPLTRSESIVVTVYPGADGVVWDVEGSDMGDEYDSRLSLTDTAFENMKDKGVPQDVIDQLQSLKGKVFSDKDDKTAEEQFTDALKARLGEEQAAQYESVILEDAHYPYNSQFKITDESLTDIRNEGVPQDIISQLEALKGNFYQTEDNFMDALEATIGEEQAANYRLAILQHTTTEYVPIALNIGIPQLIDPNETLSDIIISGVPAGAELSAGTDNGDGTWTLTSDQLAGLTITPPAYSGDDFTLEVSVTSSESEADGGDTNTTTETIDIKVNALANQPNIDVQDANIEED